MKYILDLSFFTQHTIIKMTENKRAGNLKLDFLTVITP